MASECDLGQQPSSHAGPLQVGGHVLPNACGGAHLTPLLPRAHLSARCYAHGMAGQRKGAGMGPEGTEDLSPDMEMSTKEAAAYLSGPVGYTVSPRIMYGLKSLNRGPVVEKRGRNLVYRKSALDAFLRENGTDMRVWIEGIYRDVADQLRAISAQRPDLQFGPLVEALDDRDPEGWDPDLAK